MLIPRGKNAVIHQYVISALVGTKGSRTLNFYCGTINPAPIKKDLERTLCRIDMPPLCINGQLQYIISHMNKNYSVPILGKKEILQNAEKYIISDTVGVHSRINEVNHYLAWYYGICNYTLFPYNIISDYHEYNTPVKEKRKHFHMRVYNKIISKLNNTEFTL